MSKEVQRTQKAGPCGQEQPTDHGLPSHGSHRHLSKKWGKQVDSTPLADSAKNTSWGEVMT